MISVDEIFYTDLPDEYEREQILRIHCKKRKVDDTKIKPADMQILVEKTANFVGAELEQIVCDARFMSFAARKSGQPNMSEFTEAIRRVVPIAEGEKENIDEIRRVCANRARSVSRKRETATTVKSRVVNVR